MFIIKYIFVGFKYCKKCILSTSVPGVVIDKNDLCQYCGKNYERDKEFMQRRKQAQKEGMAKKLLSGYRGGSKPYDVMVMYSGGKDSGYLLYLLKKYGLNPLAFHVKNPFVPRVAQKNVSKLCQKLNIDLIECRPAEDLYRKTIEYALKNTEEVFGRDFIFSACAVCSRITFLTAYKTAIKMKIGLVVSGYQENQVMADQNIYYIGNKFRESVIRGKPDFIQFSSLNDSFILNLIEKTFNGSIKEICARKYHTLVKNNFPDIFFPLVIDQSNAETRLRELDKANLIEKKDLLVSRTNCGAVMLFEYLSYKKYNSPFSAIQKSQYLRFGGDDNFSKRKIDRKREEYFMDMKIAKKRLFLLVNTEFKDIDSGVLKAYYKEMVLLGARISYNDFIRRFKRQKRTMDFYADYFNINLTSME